MAHPIGPLPCALLRSRRLCRVAHLKDAERRDHSLGVAAMMPEHDRGRCSAAPARPAARPPRRAGRLPILVSWHLTVRAPTRIVEQWGAQRRLRHAPTSAGHHGPTARAPVCFMPPIGPQAESGARPKRAFSQKSNHGPDPLHRRFIIQRGHEHTRTGH